MVVRNWNVSGCALTECKWLYAIGMLVVVRKRNVSGCTQMEC